MSVRARGGGRAGGGVHSLSCESCLLRGGTGGAGWDGGERGIATSSTCTGRTPERWREGEEERWKRERKRL